MSPPPTASSPAAKGSSTSNIDADLERFAAAVREDEARRKAEQQRRADQAEHARQLDEARAELDRAIAAVRRAKDTGKGRAEADEAWKAAKARVIELESGAPPSWAKAAPAATVDAEGDHATDPADEPDIADDGDGDA